MPAILRILQLQMPVQGGLETGWIFWHPQPSSTRFSWEVRTMAEVGLVTFARVVLRDGQLERFSR